MPTAADLNDLPAPAQKTRSLAPGRVSTYTAVGAFAGIIPLPWLPDSFARRIRGALVQDIVDHLGVQLSRDARDILSDPGGSEGRRSWLGQAVYVVGKRVLARMGPAALLPPARSAFYTFVLGHLFHRYVSTVRSATGPIEAEEARRVRYAINQSVRRALRTSAPPEPAIAPKTQDDRDAVTRAIDALLRNAAGVPAWLVRRIEAGFDESFAQESSIPGPPLC